MKNTEIFPTGQTFIQFLIIMTLFVYSASMSADLKSINVRQKTIGLASDLVAILIEVKIEELSCLMQLDTGLETSIIYAAVTGENESLKGDELNVKKLQIADSVTTAKLKVIHSSSTPFVEVCKSKSNPAGSIGVQQLRLGTLTLDLKKSVTSYTEGPFKNLTHKNILQIPFSFKEKTNLPYVNVTTQDGATHLMVFDTGSAPLGITVGNFDDWRKISKTADKRLAKKFNSYRFGEPVTCYSSELGVKMKLSNADFPEGTTATFCEDATGENFFGNSLFGTIGLAAFKNMIINIDFVSKKIFIDASK